MRKNKVENNDFEKFVVFFFFKAVKKSSPKEGQVLIGDGNSNDGPNEQSHSKIADFRLRAS
jgi:hypothetical protein